MAKHKSKKSHKSASKSKSKGGQPEKAYCVVCKSKKSFAHGVKSEIKKAKNGNFMKMGKCSSCGTKMCAFFSGKK